MTRLSSFFTVSPVRSEELSFSLRLTISWVTGFTVRSSMGFWGIGLAWKNQLEVFLQVTVERVFQLADVQL